MSQKKVDRYKEQKANRKQTIKKEKTMLALEKAAGVLVLVAAIAWICFSVYAKVNRPTSTENTVAENTVMDVTALNDYLTEVNNAASAVEADETEVPEELTAAEEETNEEAAAEAETAEETTAEAETTEEAAAEETEAEAETAEETPAE